MALPSAFTLGSVAFVVAAGVGLAAVASNASDEPAANKSAAHEPATSGVPSTTPTPPAETTTKPPSNRLPRERRTPVPKVFIEVYNNSGISGLAASRAKILERAGWNVTATDNWYGNIPANTVYYPGNLRAQARQLAKVLDITRLRPAVSPMQFDRLTVILTSES